ncbi:hypothetical protein DPMN_143020 [Dreissena polymorpha]|uniref:Uncharacterized protein n=1 Tax=Dreissena polymorpha TaxID=45954 RepID=A0A9D4JMR7_DREPO|nr:hypothetical protein DPMN_143020 [Dreissena polymorpha]
MRCRLLLSLTVFLFSDFVAGVKNATTQNVVRFVNIEGDQNISINIQLADQKSIAYIRMYINDTTENQAAIIVHSSFQQYVFFNIYKYVTK